MKKLFLSLFALGCAVSMAAQNEIGFVILQHGNEYTAFKGSAAVVDALSAADANDVITISQGVFEGDLIISKPISIYGAGMETNTALGIEQTQIRGNVYIGSATESDVISKVTFEGIYFSNAIYVGRTKNDEERSVTELNISKCKVCESESYWGYGITLSSNIQNVTVDNSVVASIQGSNESIVATCMSVRNCYISGTVSKLNEESSVLIDHCIINGCYDRNYAYAQFRFTNSIFTSTAGYSNSNYWLTYNAIGSYIDHCIYNGVEHGSWYSVEMHTAYGNITNCHQIRTSEIFVDADNANYASERTFEINNSETLLGTDNTPIGLHGGNGLSKVPSTPVVKNLTTQQEGTTLKVSYEAEVR